MDNNNNNRFLRAFSSEGQVRGEGEAEKPKLYENIQDGLVISTAIQLSEDAAHKKESNIETDELWYVRKSIARILAVQGTYAMIFSEYNIDELISYLHEVKDILEFGNFDNKLLLKILNSIVNNFHEADAIITQHLSERWSIERLNLIGLAVIKTAICELLCSRVDSSIIINEYVNIAAQVLEKSEINFVNAILSKVQDIQKIDNN